MRQCADNLIEARIRHFEDLSRDNESRDKWIVSGSYVVVNDIYTICSNPAVV